jgi:hypothetical protein
MNETRKIVAASDSGISIRSSGDIPDVIAACLGAGSAGLVLTEDDLTQEFFDLRTGLAGEFFQKIVNYGLRVAFVLPTPGSYGERFSELVFEHRSHGMIRFFNTKDEAETWLST